MDPGVPSNEDPAEAYKNWRAGDPDPTIKPKADAIDAPNLASGNENSTNQIAPMELSAETPTTIELHGVSRIHELTDLRKKINRATEDVNKHAQMSDQEIANHIEDKDLTTRDGELLTVEEFRQRSLEWLTRLRSQEQPILEKYQELARLARTKAHAYAERIPSNDRVALTDQGRKAAIVYLHRVANIGTHDELYHLIIARPDFWQGSASEVAEKFDNMVNGIADRPQDFNITDTQFGRSMAGLPDSVQQAMLGILVNEGNVSVGSESRLVAERIRQNSNESPTELLHQRSLEVRNRAKNLHKDEQQWMRTEAIQSLLRELYPELSK